MVTRCDSLSSFQIHTKNAKRPNCDNERSPVNLSAGNSVDLYPNVDGKRRNEREKKTGKCSAASVDARDVLHEWKVSFGSVHNALVSGDTKS